MTSFAPGAANRFHSLVRGQHASPVDAIALNEPRRTTIGALVAAAKTGKDVLDALPSVAGEFLLKGITGYARRDWGTALANLWIVVEQLTSHLWKERILDRAQATPSIPGRVDMLRDHRTWTIGTRHEMLFQLNLIDAELLESLSKARRARNALSHDGRHPDEDQATAVLSSVESLLKALLPDFDSPFFEMDLGNSAVSNPFDPRDGEVHGAPKYWMAIKKLPGEEELEKLEAEARKVDAAPK